MSSRAKYIAPASKAFDKDTNTAFESDCEFDTWTVCEIAYTNDEDSQQRAGRRCFERKACRAGSIWLGWDMSYHAGINNGHMASDIVFGAGGMGVSKGESRGFA